jgi:DNA-binding response OmpR family regulator
MKKILIVDDEPHIRQMMRLTLEAAGYQVDEAADGQAGLDRFGDGSGYHAVLLDQRMPGLDGLETLRQIKQRAPEACIVMVTAYASIELAVDAMRMGAADFLRKPMTPETLRGATVAALARAPIRPLTHAPSSSPRLFDIAVVTMNGFQILRADTPPSSAGHVFRVKHIADQAEFSVTVSIDPDAVERVARLTRRRLDAGGAFWRLQAERLLSAYVWSEAKGPANGSLTVRDVSREDLDVAARWEEG